MLLILIIETKEDVTMVQYSAYQYSTVRTVDKKRGLFESVTNNQSCVAVLSADFDSWMCHHRRDSLIYGSV